jgi:hypothetical protein
MPEKIDEWRQVVTGSPTALLLAAEVLFPSFLEVDGFVYIPVDADEAAAAKYVRQARDRREWGRADLAGRRDQAAHQGLDLAGLRARLWPGEPVVENSLALASLLARTWPLALAEQFPGRHFRVEVDPYDAEHDHGPVVRVREI